MSKSQHDVLQAAAQTALRAPSIFNTQPWRWRVDGNSLELYADRDRVLPATDPDGRLLLLSCGSALQHARVSLAAAGWGVVVDRLPDPADPDLLARIRLVEPVAPSENDLALDRAVPVRRTDRRPFRTEAVPDGVIQQLAAAAEREGVRVHDTTLEQMPMLAVAVAYAQSREISNEAYRGELMRWTNRPAWSNDGVPPSTGVARAPRRVPVRDFVLSSDQGIEVPPGGDRGARYLIVNGSGEEPLDWLRAGEGASAVLLTAVSLGLAVAPISDVIEVEHPRGLLRGLLRTGGYPYLVIRCGYADDTTAIDPAPRRDAAEVVRGSQP